MLEAMNTPLISKLPGAVLPLRFGLMSMTIEQIVEEASKWPDDVVAELVDRIMVAKHGGIAPAVDAAWRSEIRRRIGDMESGKVQGIPLEDSLAKARAIIGR